jgi:hypothetical protein
VGFHYLDIKRFDKTGYEEVIPISQAFIHDDFDPRTMVTPKSFNNKDISYYLIKKKTILYYINPII